MVLFPQSRALMRTDHNSLKKIGFILFQLFLLGSFIYHFHIEEQLNLPFMFPYMGAAFLIHFLTPRLYRPYIFAGATIVGMFMLFSFFEALALMGISLGMIGITNLPIHLRWRKLILLIVTAFLVYIRMNPTQDWFTSHVVTILGSFFMFRMLVFMYEIKFQKEPVSFITQVSYFLMLPNLVFPLFPVVDFKLFHRQYYAQEELETYQRGVYLIARGTLCLFLSRIIYTYFLPSESEVDSLYQLLSYISLSYLLTLRLAGIFHFSVGVLHLFGHRLPEVFHHHFFASSFSDLWKRINIYWKDFIIKLYFNPLYFKLKKLGTKQAIFMATLLSFALSLFLHQYQTFWLTGVLTLRINDVLFWGFFGLSIAFGTLIPNRWIKASRSLQGQIQVGRILLTFFTMSMLWSFWVSNDVQRWLTVIQNLNIPVIEVFYVLGAAILFIGIFGYLWAHQQRFTDHPWYVAVNRKATLAIFGLLILPMLIFNSITLERFWNDRMDGNDIHALFNFMLKDQDVQEEIAGYYDQILASSDLMNPSASNEVMWSKMFQVNLYQKDVLYKSNDPYKRKMDTSRAVTIQGIAVSTNECGMYDHSYSKIPEKGVYRIAFLGASIEMGWAIPFEEGLDKLIEKRLNAETWPADDIDKIEILNFSVPSRTLINHYYALQHQVIDFQPDMLVYFDHDETSWLNALNGFRELNYGEYFDGYVDSIYASGLSKDRSIQEELARTEPFRERLIKEVLEQTKAIGDSLESRSILVLMPELTEKKYANKYQHGKLAKSVGFAEIDLSNLFELDQVSDYSLDDIGHPTQEANRLIAEALYMELRKAVAAHVNER